MYHLVPSVCSCSCCHPAECLNTIVAGPGMVCCVTSGGSWPSGLVGEEQLLQLDQLLARAACCTLLEIGATQLHACCLRC